MKPISISIAAIFCLCSLQAVSQAKQSADARRNPIRERIHLATDKDNYLSGEIVWMKLLTSDHTGVPVSFSRVGYVELAGEDGSNARVRVELRNGTGEGSMVLPSTLPTGWYRLVAYTRWMRNEGAQVFFEKRIGIVNPSVAEVPHGSDTEADSTSATRTTDTPAPVGGLKVTTDDTTYSSRSEVRLDISGIPADIHTLSVSATAADPLGGFATPTLGMWKAALPSAALPFSNEYEAEYEGPLVTGRLVSRESGATVYSNEIDPMAGFPGDGVNFFSGTINNSGRVVFRTTRTAGFSEIATTMRNETDKPWRIDIDTPFAEESLARPAPSFPLDAIDREALMRQSLAMQLQYAYVNDSLRRAITLSSRFQAPPQRSYKMEEWRQFATMREVITEFVQFAQFTRVDDNWYLSVLNRELITGRTYSLVLLDGIPIIDHDIILNYNPLLIKRIDVYSNKYLFGNTVYYGMVAFYTDGNRYPELQPDPFTQILPYEAPQARRLFYTPDYSRQEVLSSRLPDYRHTLYWDADVSRGDDGKAEVRFFTSDLSGTYRVLVEGITASGKPVSAVCTIEVR